MLPLEYLGIGNKVLKLRRNTRVQYFDVDTLVELLGVLDGYIYQLA